jgi:hypothetical protein
MKKWIKPTVKSYEETELLKRAAAKASGHQDSHSSAHNNLT